MQIMIWNGKAWITHRLDARSFWLKIVPSDRPAAPVRFGMSRAKAQPTRTGGEPAGAAYRAPAVSAAR